MKPTPLNRAVQYVFSVRIRLLGLVLLAVLPAFGIVVRTGVEHRRDLMAQARRDTHHMVRTLAQQQERMTANAAQLLTTLATLPQIQQRQTAEVRSLFEDLKRRNPDLDALLAVAPDGRTFATVPATPEPLDLSDRPYIQEAIQRGRFSPGHAILSRIDGRPVFPFATPALDSAGQLRAVVLAGLNNTFFDWVFQQADLPAGSVMVLTDRDGIVIHAAPNSAWTTGQADRPDHLALMNDPSGEGLFECRDPDGVDRFYAYHGLSWQGDEPYLRIRVGVPTQAISARARELMHRNILLLGLAALVTALAAVGLGELGLVRPLRRLAAVTTRVAAGDLSVRAGLGPGRGELDRLGAAFDTMAASLQQRDRDRRRSEERFAEIFHANPDAVALIRHDGLVLDVNRQFCEMFGVDKHALVGQDILSTDIWPDLEDRRRWQDNLRRSRRVDGVESVLQRSDGRMFRAMLSAALIELAGEPCELTMIRDITGRVLAEETLRQTQKLDSLGLLAGGIAHDFNNFLTGILGNLHLAQHETGQDSPVAVYLERAVQAALNAAGLARQMLAYSGRGGFDIRPHDLNRLIEELVPLLAVGIPKTTRLHQHLSAELPHVEGDRAQLQQLVMNLVTNAADAIGAAGGLIRLETARVWLNSHEAEGLYPGREPRCGDFVTLTVTDTGCGIPPDILDRIFDPFFTTKEAGRGLGLAAMHGILRGHGAGIRIHTTVGQGTSFTVFFPAVAQSPSPPDPAVQPDPSLPPASPLPAIQGRILLVDDDPFIRQAIGEALTSAGIPTDVAADGLDATAIFQSTPDSWHLVIMDLTMPRAGGAEAAAAIRALRPDVPILFSSGFSTQTGWELDGPGPVAFLAKPYQIEDLFATIRRLTTTPAPDTDDPPRLG